MRWFFFWLALGFAAQMWLSLKIARAHRGLAWASFVFFPVAVVAYFKLRDDPETNITAPLIATAVCTALLLTSGAKLATQGAAWLQEEQDAAADSDPDGAAPASPTADAAAPEPTAAAHGDPFDALSAAFSAAGIRHTLTRVDAGTKLPPGVREAALVAAWPLGAGDPQSPAALTATVYRCDSVPRCGALAGQALRSAVAPRPRVLQNGMLVLSVPAATADDAGPLQAALAEAFRRGSY